MTSIGPADLPNFIARIDALGGPGDPRVDDYWRHVSYAPDVEVDTSHDPFGEAYFDAQLALYREISGRSLDQTINEHTIFNRQAHLASRNPYNHGDPGALATQIVQLATAMRLARPRRDARIVDMGCGWGLSSELAAYLGLKVEAVDINRDFVALVSERSQRYGYDIKAVQASFDTYVAQAPVDLFLFYECLHHAVEPWSLLPRLSAMLAPGGKIVACGEPINSHWWPHWGLRLDPMSIYCIHKHGWFESGWSLEFLTRCFDRALLNVQVTSDPDPLIGQFVVGTRDEVLGAGWLGRNSTVDGAMFDGPYLVAGEKTRLCFTASPGPGRSALVIQNFRPAPIRATLKRDGGAGMKLTLVPGETRLAIDGIDAGTVLQFESETWRPSEEIGNLDTRRLAFHIGGIVPDRGQAALDKVVRLRG